MTMLRAAVLAGALLGVSTSVARGAVPCTAAAAQTAAVPPAEVQIRDDASCLIDAAAPLPHGARLLDLRSQHDYARLHIPGAINQPLHSLLNAPPGAMVVYDGGRLRGDALLLCERLARYGLRDARVIRGGIAAWAQSRRPASAFEASRLSDAEAAAALVAGAAVVTLGDGFTAALRALGVDVTPGTHARQTILLAGPGTAPERITSRLVRRAGQDPVLYWMGTPAQLSGIVGSHLAREERRLQGPMVDSRCPGL